MAQVHGQQLTADSLWANAPLDVHGSLACIRAAEKPVLAEASPSICQQSYCRIRPTFTAATLPGPRACDRLSGYMVQLGRSWQVSWPWCVGLQSSSACNCGCFFALLDRQGGARKAQQFAACAGVNGCSSMILLQPSSSPACQAGVKPGVTPSLHSWDKHFFLSCVGRSEGYPIIPFKNLDCYIQHAV